MCARRGNMKVWLLQDSVFLRYQMGGAPNRPYYRPPGTVGTTGVGTVGTTGVGTVGTTGVGGVGGVGGVEGSPKHVQGQLTVKNQ